MIVDVLFTVVVAVLFPSQEVDSAAYSFQTRHQCETFRAGALADLQSRIGGKYRFYIGDCVAVPVEEVRPE